MISLSANGTYHYIYIKINENVPFPEGPYPGKGTYHL